MQRSYRLGVDVGGTFTDFVLVDFRTGEQWRHKLLTSAADPSRAVIQGVREIVAQAGFQVSDIGIIVHGTTLIANALIERKGARTGLLTTKGFEDLLEIRREKRYDMYDLAAEIPQPLVPSELRVGVPERTLADGTQEIDRVLLDRSIDDLLARQPESVAICYLHSYRNSRNELMTLEVLKKRREDLPVSLSSVVSPEIGEYERLSTTVANAFVQKLFGSYVRGLAKDLSAVGFKGALYLMVSNGGLTDVETAIALPIRLVESGPAGGCMAGVYYSRITRYDRLIVFDMGGTTAKMSLAEEKVVGKVTHTEVARLARLKKGSGLPLKVSSVDLIEIGAGGGTIARVDRLGLLKVGPDSAGADPGPACYGLGGLLPTVTDADLVLGYLSPDSFLAGKMRLDVDRAVEAVRKYIAEPLGLDVTQAAWGIHRIVNENMANAARVHILEKARDPQWYQLLALGGAGPVHACRVAQAVKAQGVISPLAAGVKSAMGFLVAPLAIDLVYSQVLALEELRPEDVEAIFARLERQGREMLARGGIRAAETRCHRKLDMRYVGQGHEIQVQWLAPADGHDIATALRAAFLDEYQRQFGRSEPDIPIEVVNWRVEAEGPLPDLPEPPAGDQAATGAPKGERRVYFPECGDYASCPVYDREALAPGFTSEGPAVVEEAESTLVILPGMPYVVDSYRNVHVHMLNPARWEATPMNGAKDLGS